MPELTDEDAIRLAVEYYSKKFRPEDAVRIVALLSKVDVAGLIQFAFEQGVQNERGSK